MNNLCSLFLTAILFCSFSFLGLSQWQQTDGPRGSRVIAYASEGDEIYVGTQYGGIFRSDNNGNSWSARNGAIGNFNVYALAMDGDKVYAGTNAGWGGFFVSDDDGLTWTELGNGWMNFAINCIAVSGLDLYVGTAGSGIRVSHDGGLTWAASLVGIVPYLYFSTSDVKIDGDKVYCSINSKLYVSNDQAATWTQIDSELLEAGVGQIKINSSGLLVAANSGILTSPDSGANWINISSGLPMMPYGYILSSTANFIYVAGNYGEGLFYSNNNGFSWSPLETPGENKILSIHAKSNGKLLLQTLQITADFSSPEPGALYRTENNAAQWEDITNEITDTYCLSIEATPTKLCVGTFETGIYTSNDNGSSWVNQGQRNTYQQHISVFGNTFLTSGNAGVLRSVDGGQNWAVCNQGLPSVGGAFAKVGSDIFIGTSYGVCVSTDDGITWALSNNGLQNIVPNSIFSFNDLLFVGTDVGIYKSSNFGNSWTLTDAYWVSGIPITSFAHINGIIFACASDVLYSSSDNGNTWISGTFGMSSYFKLEATGSKLFASSLGTVANSIGVIVSFDYGLTWQTANQGLSNNMVFDMAADNQWLYVATLGSGVFKRPLSEFISNSIEEARSSTITVFPNPANDNIVVNIDAQLNGNEFIIRDMTGKLVLISQIRSTRFNVDLSAFSKGIYILQIGNNMQKLIVE